MTEPIDYDHELSNGWDKLGVMVLTELRRLSDGQDALGVKIDQSSKNLVELQTFNRVNHDKIQDHERRLRDLDKNQNVQDGARSQRRSFKETGRAWTIAGATLLVTLALGVASLIITLKHPTVVVEHVTKKN